MIKRCVTVLTHGFTIDPSANGVDAAFLQMANQIAEVGNDGLILHYHKRTGDWLPIDEQGRFNRSLTGGLAPEDTGYLDALVNGIRTQYVGRNKSLVLLPEWSLGRESIIPDAGFSEASADALFAAMVQLDQRLYTPPNGGSDPAVGFVNGQFVRHQGALLNSPLHFVGFSRGTVVNSEIHLHTEWTIDPL